MRSDRPGGGGGGFLPRGGTLPWVTRKKVLVMALLIVMWMLLVFSNNRLKTLLVDRSSHVWNQGANIKSFFFDESSVDPHHNSLPSFNLTQGMMI